MIRIPVPLDRANQEPIDPVAVAPFATIICGIAGRAVAVLMRRVEVPCSFAVFAPCRDEFPILGELHNAVIGPCAMPVGDEDVASGRDDDRAPRRQMFRAVTGHSRLA